MRTGAPWCWGWNARCEADVLGLPRRRQLKVAMRYHEVFANLERVLGARRPVIGDMALHFCNGRALWVILCAARGGGRIGCRDVAGVFAAHFDVPVTQWLVRGEAKFPGSVEETHWPTGYARMMARMDDVGPGDLVLVGAGILGKAYVAAAARRGQPPSISAACSTDGRASSAAKGGSAMVPNFP
jgi:threonine dehydrogenase-like Zn-dependent dehydrogenase